MYLECVLSGVVAQDDCSASLAALRICDSAHVAVATATRPWQAINLPGLGLHALV